ncbi:OPT superfamily [Sorochytrium milnesiophthora]
MGLDDDPQAEKLTGITLDDPADKPGSSLEKKKVFVADEEFEQSIQALLPTTDDVRTPSLTFRVWFLGTIFCLILGALNQVLTFRPYPFSVTAYVAVLLSYPLGKFMAATLPTTTFRLPLYGECSLNPGPYSAKETILIYTMASTGTTGVYGTDNLFVQKYYYNMDIGAAAGIFFLLATMLSGFGVAGICQRFLVRPAHMMWPSALPQIALVNSFHAGDTSDRDPDVGEHGKRHWSRLKVFGIACLAMFVWEWFPSFIAPTLGTVSIICYISHNSIAQEVGSAAVGFGVASFTLDWSYITGASMNFPWWVQVNSFVSSLVFIWILTPWSWRSNWFGQPPLSESLNTPHVFNKTGDTISARGLVDPKTFTLVEELYTSQQPFWISPFFAWCYFGSLALFTASLAHTACWYGKDIWTRFRHSRLDSDKDDIHCILIDKYPTVPTLWYAAWFVIPTIIGIVVCHVTQIDMPWYLSLLTIFVTFLLSIPFAVIQATSGVQLATNVISEFLVGLIYPGHPVVMMAFKCFSVTVCSAVLTLLQDLKVGHYMKIPPRHMFIAQMYSQIVAVLVCYGTLVAWTNDPRHVDWVVHSKKYEKDPVAKNWSSAAGYQTYFSASLLWGALGPKRFFINSYGPLVIAGFLSGLLLPIICKLAYEFIGGPVPWALINAPILFNILPPGSNNGGPLSQIITSLIFQYFLYRYRTKWWQRYNYVLSVAFDVATALVTILVALALANTTMPVWGLAPDPSVHNTDYCDAVTDDKTRLGLAPGQTV